MMRSHEHTKTQVERGGIRRKRVLIVSSYKTSCGIAAFAETLETLLRDEFEVDVFALDQFVLRSDEPKLVAAGEALIARLVEQAPKYDVVNLQWEPGLLGLTLSQVARRFRRIVASTPNMVVTVHTVMPTSPFRLMRLIRPLMRGRLLEAARYALDAERSHARRSYATLVQAAASPSFHLIVHTRREKRFFTHAIGIRNVHDHPLSCIRQGWPDALADAAAAKRRELEAAYGADKTFIGFFGFLSEYKGVETAIDALHHLPDNHVLLLFGGIHPEQIRARERVNPYLAKLIASIEGAAIRTEQDRAPSRRGRRRSLTDRVFFLGAPDDFEFAVAIKACDVNVFPYIEVGQSASGPVSQSVELGKRTIVSRNKTFIELDQYFPGRLDFVDIGNHLQLAQKIVEVASRPEPRTDNLPYDNQSLRRFYADVLHRASGPAVRRGGAETAPTIPRAVEQPAAALSSHEALS